MTATLLGGLAGVGLALVLAGTRRTTSSVASVLARYDDVVRGAGDRAGGRGRWTGSRTGLAPSDGSSPSPIDPDGARLLARVGGGFAGAASRLGRPLLRPEDLAILGRSRDRHLAAIGTCALAGGAGLAALALAAGVVGLHLSTLGPVIGAAVGSIGGAAIAGRSTVVEARREREAFVRGLSCWLELVALAQAGGMGVESALEASAEIADDPTFLRIRAALDRSRVGPMTPWTALAELGRRIGVAELEELAATLNLAGSEGARIRTSLVTKSASMRQRQMSSAEAEANATTERLFLPSIVMMIAFVMFLMYPAGVRLAHVF